MIQFYSTINLNGNADLQNRVHAKMKVLLEKFGDRHCNCHPNYQWVAGIKLSKDNVNMAHEVTTNTTRPCTFLTDILDAEINPFLQQ